MKKSYLAAWLMLPLMALAASKARGQVLADRVPADATAYVGWAGTDALGAAYDASHLKGLLNTFNLPQVLAANLDTALRQNPQEIEDFKVIQEWMTTIAKSPTAVYFGGLDFTNPNAPVPHLTMFSKIGKIAAVPLAEKLNAIMTRNKNPGEPPVGVFAAGDFLMVYIGDAGLEPRLHEISFADNLAASETFKKTLAHLGAAANDPALVVYVNGEQLFHMIDTVVQNNLSPQVQGRFAAISAGLGLASLRQAAWAGGFDGPNWRSATFIGMGDRRTGLLSLFDSRPLSDDVLKLIPQSATFGGVFRLDGERLLADVTNIAASIDDQTSRQFQTALQQFYAFTGVDLKNELLPALGDEFAFYGSPDAAGNVLRGYSIVNTLKDVKKAESALGAAENFINLMILQRNPDSKSQFRPQPLPPPFDKITAHVITLDLLSPSWAITDGKLFFSLSPEGLQGALQAAGAAGTQAAPGIANNPVFANLRKSFRQDAISSFAFDDLGKTAPESYSILSRILARTAAANPAQTPYILPPLNRIAPDLGPDLRINWSDADGFHSRDAGPFPFAAYLNPTQFLQMRIMEIIENRQAQSPAPAPTRGPVPGLP